MFEHKKPSAKEGGPKAPTTVAQNCMQRLKSTRHPNVLLYKVRVKQEGGQGGASHALCHLF